MNKNRRLALLFVMIIGLGLWGSWLSVPVSVQGQDRPVIKNGMVEVIVEDTETAVAEALDLTTTFNGYVVEQQQWDDSAGFKYATINVGVPVRNFESLFQSLKRLGMVQNESVMGQDVTDETVDLQSRLDNLYETQTRMRSFLDVATGVSETLKVHQELVVIEDEIGELQGRLNFLDNRSDSATVHIEILPFIPTATPTVTSTATPTPTATPLPEPESWQPGDTAQVAVVQLQDTAQETADIVLYRLIVCGPWLLILGFFFWLGLRIYSRR